jgi:membrane-associated phospholipid phosphatase
VNILARVISFVFHPLLMATYLLVLLAWFLPAALYPVNAQAARSFLIVIFTMTFLLPAINIFVFKILGTISSFAMKDRKERIRPFFLITIMYCFITLFFSYKMRINTDDSLFKLLLIIDCLVIAASIITFFYKVSIHSIGIMGLLGVIIPLNRVAENNSLFLPTIVLLIIAGLVMSARLQLNSHTPREVLVGAITGFLTGFFGIIILF